MAVNIKYRQSSAATVPTGTTTKGAPLTSLEIDGNFRSIKEGIETETARIDDIILNGIGSILARHTATATDGQTVFNLPFTYSPGANNLVVFVNGSLVERTVDYTETSGTVVTFLSGLEIGQEVTFLTNVSPAPGVLYSPAGVTTYTFPISGATSYTLPVAILNKENTQVYINGVYQEKTTYNISGVSLIFTTAPIGSGNIEIVVQSSLALGETVASQVEYTPAGVDAEPRTVQSKLRDVVSVFDFMTSAQIAAVQVGTALIDVTAEIQAAITAARRVYLPAGNYKITSALAIASNGTIIFGDGMESTTITNTNTSGGHAFSAIGTGPDAPLSKQHITIQDLSIVGATGGGDGIHFEYCMDSTVDRVRISDCGGYGLFTNNCFSNSFRYLRFTDNENHNMRLAAASNQIVVLGCRFISAGTSNNKSGLLISDGYGISVIGCSMESNNIGLEIGQGQNIAVIGCYFEANRSHSIRIGAAAAAYGVTVQDTYMNGLVGGVPTASYSVLISNNSQNIEIRNCTMSEVTVQHIAGSYTNLLTFGNRFVGSGVGASANLVSDQVYTNLLSFPAVQVPSTNVNTLDDYEEGALTTTLGISFGGGTTGIAYGTRTGRYVKIGKLVTVTFVISLTAKGSSTGAARVTGLPFTAVGATATGSGVLNQYYNMSGLTGSPTLYVENGLDTATLFMFGATNAASVTDANFTATSSLWGTITYEAAN